MSYQEIVFDGCNGWKMGERLSKEQVDWKYPEARSRNNDGLLEAGEENDILLVPVS